MQKTVAIDSRHRAKVWSVPGVKPPPKREPGTPAPEQAAKRATINVRRAAITRFPKSRADAWLGKLVVITTKNGPFIVGVLAEATAGGTWVYLSNARLHSLKNTIEIGEVSIEASAIAFFHLQSDRVEPIEAAQDLGFAP